jgi:inosine/xanthosine triphosphate pyrophosphatase family protein
MSILPIRVIYCSWSPFKKEEWSHIKGSFELTEAPGSPLGKLFDLEFRNVPTTEPLLCDLEKMVRFKVESAYRAVRVPCIVEHAGLVLEGYEDKSFPGGLTQPMWDALDANQFIAACAPLSTRATARAIIGYCDGMNITTFVGETKGHLSDKPRGSRAFYWDTVFCPDGFGKQTYAEIVGDDRSGLIRKLEVSQSVKALKKFMAFRLKNEPSLFPGL